MNGDAFAFLLIWVFVVGLLLLRLRLIRQRRKEQGPQDVIDSAEKARKAVRDSALVYGGLGLLKFLGVRYLLKDLSSTPGLSYGMTAEDRVVMDLLIIVGLDGLIQIALAVGVWWRRSRLAALFMVLHAGLNLLLGLPVAMTGEMWVAIPISIAMLQMAWRAFKATGWRPEPTTSANDTPADVPVRSSESKESLLERELF